MGQLSLRHQNYCSFCRSDCPLRLCVVTLTPRFGLLVKATCVCRKWWAWCAKREEPSCLPQMNGEPQPRRRRLVLFDWRTPLAVTGTSDSWEDSGRRALHCSLRYSYWRNTLNSATVSMTLLNIVSQVLHRQRGHDCSSRLGDVQVWPGDGAARLVDHAKVERLLLECFYFCMRTASILKVFVKCLVRKYKIGFLF